VVDPEEVVNCVKELWQDGNSLATSTKIRDTIVIKEKFDYLYANENGKLIAVVVNNDGSTTETEVNPYKSPNQCLITDVKGDSLVIDKNGRPMGISEYRATGGNKALLNEYHRKKDSAAVWYVSKVTVGNRGIIIHYSELPKILAALVTVEPVGLEISSWQIEDKKLVWFYNGIKFKTDIEISKKSNPNDDFYISKKANDRYEHNLLKE